MTPNSPKTPLRNVRIDVELWNAAKTVAAIKGETVSDVVRTSLVRYVSDHNDLLPEGHVAKIDRAGGPLVETKEKSS